MQTLNLTKEDAEKIFAIKAVLEKHYHRRYTHQDLAQMVGTNESRLRVGFKQIVNKTISDYLSEVRMEKVKEMLENSDLSLKVIAIRVGLDRSNLLRCFKKFTGCTPRQWRNNIRKNGVYRYANS